MEYVFRIVACYSLEIIFVAFNQNIDIEDVVNLIKTIL